jgi:hypothetical protein
MTIRLSRPVFLAVLLLAAVLSMGCSGGGTAGDSVGQMESLAAIRNAYVAATNRLGHPPNNLEELKPSLAELGNVDTLLVSPNDKLPYVIVFGADPAKHVIAFEQQGTDGLRMVVYRRQPPKGLTREQLEQLEFPVGYKMPELK